MEYVIETRNLTKKFPKKVAVDHVNIHVQKGDIYGFIGRNGAGKTTAMKVILGMLDATDGSVALFGNEKPEKERKRVGSLIEAPGLYKHCTAFENMKRFAIIAGGSDEEINEILKFVGLGDVGKKKVGAFSLGMKQRLGIALSLLGNPECLILDEPINGLDPAGIKEVRDLIIKLNKEKGVTFMISSHLLDELGKVATRYGIINNGELVEEIAADELKKKCQKNLMIDVDNTKKALELLKKHNLATHHEVKDKTIVLYDEDKDPSEINALLVNNGVKVSALSYNNNSFEEFFIERLGK